MQVNHTLTKERLRDSQLEAKRRAQELLNGDYVFADTETTGVTNKDQVVELAFADNTGKMVYHSYFKPTVPMNPEATAVSGITNEMLADKPSMKEEWEHIKKVLNGRKFVFYNLGFDERMYRKTCEALGIPKNEVDDIFKGATCSMLLYSQYLDISPWIKMEEGAHAEGINIVQDHLADSDVNMMVQLLRAVADETTMPSVQKVYDNILDPKDKPEYKTKKEENIIKSIIKRTVDHVSEELYKDVKHLPDKENLGAIIKRNYPFDFNLTFQQKEKIRYDVERVYNNIKNKSDYESRNFRTYERNSEVVELFNSGYNIGRISKAKGISKFDIENILRSEFSKNPGCVDLSEFVNPKFTDKIIELSKTLPTGTKLKPIKQSLPDYVTYMDIGTVLAYDAKGMLDELKEKSQYNVYNEETCKLEKVVPEPTRLAYEYDKDDREMEF